MTCFQLHPKAKLLTSDAAGLGDLQSALRDQSAIAAGPDGITRQSGPQKLYLRSSGSTGAPKIIRRNPQSWCASFAVNQRLFGIGPDMRVAVLSGLGHSLSLYAMIEGLNLGAEVALLAGQGIKAQMQSLAGIDLLYATPTQMRLLLAAGCSKLPKILLIGGGRLDAILRERLNGLGCTVHEFYGAAETSFIALSDAATPEDAVGRAYPNVEIQCDEIGQIWARSPYVFEGYERGSGAQMQDGFVAVGEVGTFTDGLLRIFGRVDRMVTIADQNVHPEQVEAVLSHLAPQRLLAVVPRRDPLRGHHLVAYVQGLPDADLAALMKTVRAPVCVRDVYFLPHLPLLPAGKIDLQQLSALANA